jgi:hypothetical protein
MSTSSTARPKTRATGKAGVLSSAAPMGTTVPSAPSDTRMDDATLPKPPGGEPMVTSADPEGSPVPSLVAHLMEDVANLREAINVSRIREDRLFDRVSTLEAMVVTLRDPSHLPSAVATHGDEKVVMDEEDEVIEDVKSFGTRRKKTQRGRVPNRHKARSAHEDDSSSESSTSSVDYDTSLGPHGGERVRKGPRVAGLVELTTRRPEFRPLVSYRTYRLAIRSQTVDDRVTSKVNSYLKMMRHHVTEQFTGEHAIRIFDFLTVMRDAFDVNRISEGAAYLLLPHFLAGKAKHGVLSRWKQVAPAWPKYPVAVQFLLQSYATPRVIATACQRVMSAKQDPTETETQFGERLGRYAAEAGNVFNEDLLISVFLEGLQPFAAHSIRSRVTDDMTFAQVQQEAEDAGLAGRAVAASTRSLALPRTISIRSPLAQRPRTTVAMADSEASSDPFGYEDYQTPNTHRVVATVDYPTRDSFEGGTWEGGSDISVPTRDWTSCAGSAQDEQVLAMGDNRNCYLCFSPDHFIVNCPNLTAEQRASILRKRATQLQNGGLAYGSKLMDRPMGNTSRPYVAKPMGLSNGYQERAYGQNYGYSNPQGFSRPTTPNRVYSDARPPFRKAVWGTPQGEGGDRVAEPKGTNAQQVAMVETPRGNETMEHAPLAENVRRDA